MSATPGSSSAPGNAFDAFVQRGLHALYDRVLSEPVPEELLKLIDADRRK